MIRVVIIVIVVVIVIAAASLAVGERQGRGKATTHRGNQACEEGAPTNCLIVMSHHLLLALPGTTNAIGYPIPPDLTDRLQPTCKTLTNRLSGMSAVLS